MATQNNFVGRLAATRWARLFTSAALLMLACMGITAPSWAVGTLPIPVLKDVQVSATAAYDSTTSWYTYSYSVSNPASNTGEIWMMKVDITDQHGSIQILDSSGLTIPFGQSPISFDDMLNKLQSLNLPAGTSVIPIGQRAPGGWSGGFGRDGSAIFANQGMGASNIFPGSSLNGFAIVSSGLPSIRTAQILPDWELVVEDHDAVTDQDLADAGIAEAEMRFRTYTLGPSGAAPGSYTHWNQLRDDLDRAIQLGWIPDAMLGQTLKTQLADARTALDADNGTLAKTRLQTLLNTLAQANSGQRRQEVNDLLRLNAQSLIAHTVNTPIPYEPKATLLPTSTDLTIGATVSLTATVINFGDNTPLSNFQVRFKIIDGPHASTTVIRKNTDAQGKANFSYQGTKVGTDSVAVLAWKEGFELPPIHDSVSVNWTGGPDLVVPMFVPPVIESAGGKTILITETTVNTGSAASGPSVTRWYLSDQPPPLDPATARVIGERAVPALNPVVLPDGLNDAHMEQITLPADLPTGLYSLAACADANKTNVELDEQNNCSFTTLKTGQFVAVPTVSANKSPDCSKATPTTGTLWPPNHKLATVSIMGATDPDNDPLTIKIEKITQDEPVNGLGDGDTGPDGFIRSTDVQLRAERSGTGNGRVYAVAFLAEDGKGGSCTGAVKVGVPHDQGQGATPVDDGQRYDSTLP